MTDIEIAKNVKLENIENIAKKAGIEPEDIECYGKYKAKISDKIFEKVKKQENGKLVLVTANKSNTFRRRKNNYFYCNCGWTSKNRKKINALH